MVQWGNGMVKVTSRDHHGQSTKRTLTKTLALTLSLAENPTRTLTLTLTLTYFLGIPRGDAGFVSTDNGRRRWQRGAGCCRTLIRVRAKVRIGVGVTVTVTLTGMVSAAWSRLLPYPD